MTQRTDAILHINDVPALIAWFAEAAPDKLNADGDGIVGFDRTPTTRNGDAALVYVRATPDEEAAFASAPGVTVLARAPYAGVSRGHDLYIGIKGRDPETGALASPPGDVDTADGAAALYDAVWPREAVEVDDGEGGTMTYTPPALFGMMG